MPQKPESDTPTSLDGSKRLRGSEAAQFVRDVKAGMDDEALGRKYDLQGKSFQSHKIAALNLLGQRKGGKSGKPSVKIKSREVVKDIRAGLDNDELKEKYQLSSRQLQSLFRKIIDAKLMSPLELASRLSVTPSQVSDVISDIKDAVKELD
ncbi:MAG: hypothetical protein FJ118_14010 [Deltaproteobacteria bacterium]|nr:hypothetical protein [Deltaproteobacteria bacterium]